MIKRFYYRGITTRNNINSSLQMPNNFHDLIPYTIVNDPNKQFIFI